MRLRIPHVLIPLTLGFVLAFAPEANAIIITETMIPDTAPQVFLPNPLAPFAVVRSTAACCVSGRNFAHQTGFGCRGFGVANGFVDGEIDALNETVEIAYCSGDAASCGSAGRTIGEIVLAFLRPATFPGDAVNEKAFVRANGNAALTFFLQAMPTPPFFATDLTVPSAVKVVDLGCGLFRITNPFPGIPVNTLAFFANMDVPSAAGSDFSIVSVTDCPFTFRDVRRPNDINCGPDLGGTGHAALNFTGFAGSAGDTWLTVFDETPNIPDQTIFPGSVSLSADVLIHRFNNKKGAGLLALFNESAGQGLVLILYNNGNTDSLVLATVDQAGKLKTLQSVALRAGILENVWYRLTLDAVVSGDDLAVTGRVFSHMDPHDPGSAVGPQVGGEGGTLSTPPLSLMALGLQGSGEVGIVATAIRAVVDSSVTNFDVSQFFVSDISPDRPFGSIFEGDHDPGGRIITVVVDARNPKILYAASEFAGVWKSTDRAHTWFQASKGLQTGVSSQLGLGGMAIALTIDETDPERLVYATADEDFTADGRFGGLYVSYDGAANWQHVTVSGCRQPISAGKVVFGAGRAFAVTRCGLATSTNLMDWTLVKTDPSLITDQHWYIAARGETIFACNEDTGVYRSTDIVVGGKGTWTKGPDLPNRCRGLAVAPDDRPFAEAVLAAHDSEPPLAVVDVSVVNFTTNSVESLRAPKIATTESSFAGINGVFVVPRPGAPAGQEGPGISYDVFAADRARFFQLLRLPELGLAWKMIAGVHVDAWSMAFPSTYDPLRGNCIAYAAHDGGISTIQESDSPFPCLTAEKPWVRAMSGLHAFKSLNMAGISSCDQAVCPTALYLPSGDNGTWVSISFSAPGESWNHMPCCGDTGSAVVDPALPTQVITSRNGFRELFRSATGFPPIESDFHENIAPPCPGKPDCTFMIDSADSWGEPPQQAAFSQVVTLTGEPRAPDGDYIGVVSPPGGPKDLIVRNLDARKDTWMVISDDHFDRQTVAALGTSGGHRNPILYVLTRDGQIHKGRIDDSGRVPASSWMQLPSGLSGITKVAVLFVDPYDSNNIYVTDEGAGEIRSSTDGGLTWESEETLTRMATNDGEFAFGCKGDFGNGRRLCPLQQMLFVRGQPKIRVAILFPGSVTFSRDAGASWVPIDTLFHIRSDGTGSERLRLRDFIAHPYSGFYDADPVTGANHLYLALLGRGIIRIDWANTP